MAPTEPVLMEHERRLNRLLIEATVLSVDLGAARAVVDLGAGAPSPPLPWLALRAGRDRTWLPPAPGEQVVILTDGTLANGVILGSLYQNLYPAPSSMADVREVIFGDGTTISYDGGAAKLTISLAAKGKLAVSGDIEVTGNISATGEVSDSKDSMASMRGIYAKHTHTAPSGVTGTPTPATM